MGRGARSWLGWLTAAVALVAIGVVLLDLPVHWRLDLLLGGIAFAWLLVVLTLPWNLHFQAVGVLRELERSEARGLTPQVERRAIRRIAARTLLISLGLHGLSALAVLAATWWWSEWQAGPWLAAVYLGSSVLRPLGAWHASLREELRRSLGEVTHPRDDVLALQARVQQLEHLERELNALRELQQSQGSELREEVRRLERKLDQVARRFEETLEHLTDNRELLAGIRAFLRMIRETG